MRRIRWLNRDSQIWKSEWALLRKDGKQKLPSTSAANACRRIGTRSVCVTRCNSSAFGAPENVQRSTPNVGLKPNRGHPERSEGPRLRSWVMPGKQHDHSPCERSLALLGMTSRAGLRSAVPKVRLSKMRGRTKCGISACGGIIFALIFLAVANALADPKTKTTSAKLPRSHQGKRGVRQDDSINAKPASDLALRPGGERKAGALTHFVEGMAFEENGEMDRALDAYQKLRNVDPRQAQLAARVAGLLRQKDDLPQAFDV